MTNHWQKNVSLSEVHGSIDHAVCLECGAHVFLRTDGLLHLQPDCHLRPRLRLLRLTD